MGIGAPISVLGYTYLTKGMNCNLRSKKLAEILSVYSSEIALTKTNLQEILLSLQTESKSQSALDIITPASNGQMLESIFFAGMPEGITVKDLLLNYTVTFEWDKKSLFETLTELKGADSIETIVSFVLKDLSSIFIETAEKTMENRISTNFDNMKLISLIIKVHHGYQRIQQNLFLSVCNKVSSLIKSKELSPPLAYKIYSIVGEYQRLEQRYHNPRNPLIPSHILAQQRVMANLSFWTQNASSVFNFLSTYLPKTPLSEKEEIELQEILFYENKELGKIFIDQFINKGKLQLEELMWACMSCCIDPKDTFGNCLYSYIKNDINNERLKKILKDIVEFAIYKLGKITLATFAREKPVIDILNKLIRISPKELDVISSKIFPSLYNKEIVSKDDFSIYGEDSLAYRIIDVTAELVDLKGKIIEIPGTIVPYHLLPCSSFIRELKFNQMNAMDLRNEIATYNALDTKELLTRLKESIGNIAFLEYFFDHDKDNINLKQMTLACITLCLDQDNTITECFWKLVEDKEYGSIKELAMESVKFAIKDIPKLVIPQLVNYPQLAMIQEKYLIATEDQLKEIAERIMPFMKHEHVVKENCRFETGTQRLIYAILDSAAETLGIEIMNNMVFS